MRKKKDLYLILILIAAAVLSFGIIRMKQTEGNFIEIHVSGSVYGTYSLLEEQIIDLKTNRIRISEGKAYMEAADCPDKLCIRQGRIHKTGETIVCLPHQIVIEVKGANKDMELDAYTY